MTWTLVRLAGDPLQQALDEFCELSTLQKKVAKFILLSLARCSNPLRGTCDIDVKKLDKDAPGWYRAKLKCPARHTDEENGVRVFFYLCAEDAYHKTVIVTATTSREKIAEVINGKLVVLGEATRNNKTYRIVSATYTQMNRRIKNGRY